MGIFPRLSLELYGGWCLTFLYLVVNLGVPLFKKGALSRLLTPAKSLQTLGEKTFYWGAQLSWWGTLAYPVVCPLKLGTIHFKWGIALYLAGIVLTAIALWNYASASCNQPAVNGLYRFSRNPIYVAYTSVGYGMGMAIGSWFVIILHTIEVISCHFMIVDEEKYCIGKYGEDYQQYLEKTPRYFWVV
ncbi:hypothetical protein JW933_10135 [candidate division FCPU426 bacterium]|nr:hypothetical protein [candidate division FCPU426 bacterium]